MGITIGGTFSGLNVSSIISSIIAADSIPITNLQTTDTNLTTESSTIGALGTSLGQLSTQLQSLTSTLFNTQSATVSTATVGSAAITGTAPSGSVALNITQLATPTVLTGGSATGAFGDTKLTAPPPGAETVGTALNETAVAGQFFSINGKQITLSATTVLDDGNPASTTSVVGLINNSGAGVTASYDATTGKVSLTSSSPILLGSGGDTSDFLQQAQLFNNGTNAVSSGVGLGRVNPDTDLASAGLRTALTTGNFTINGVSVAYNSGDSLNTLISNINSSSAGVTAVYDSYEDQLVLTSKSSGPQSITVTDGTSNIATALRLGGSDSALQVGKSTLFTAGNSTTVRQSDSNVISSAALGIPGVTFTATGTGSTQVTVAPDVTTVANALNAFVAQYNTTQQLIFTDTSKSTTSDSSSSSTDGPLATDNNFTFLASQLREITSGQVSTSATIRMLGDLGINTNANDNTLTQVDTAKLQDALTNHLSDVISLFEDPTKGLTNSVQSVLSSYNDSLNGVIVSEQNNISQQVSFNKQQITRMQEQITVEQTNLQLEFAALDQIQGDNQALSGILNGETTGSSSTSSSSSSSSSSSFGSVGTSS